MADSRGSRDEITQLLNTLYGWDEAQFKEKVLRPYLALQKLDEVLTKDGTLTGDAERRGNEVLVKLNAKEQTFEELAKTYSEDGTAAVGGDLGFFGKGVMDPDFEAAADALKPGEVSGLVRSQFGYHIIELLDRVDDAEKGVQYHARHILFATKSVDEYVNDRIAEQNIRLFLAGYTWDDKNHWVVPSGAVQEG
ncbi:MAG: peptidyl-prolyl cis-trans isomerase [Candidatus Kerfeldbacteria bacterium]|nr:peptidyl-prolyl cis-trans isomerase [Candidatus Kerfeldbacteria bacterium]